MLATTALAFMLLAPALQGTAISATTARMPLSGVRPNHVKPWTSSPYGHLWPDRDESTRVAVDAVLEDGADSPRTRPGAQ